MRSIVFGFEKVGSHLCTVNVAQRGIGKELGAKHYQRNEQRTSLSIKSLLRIFCNTFLYVVK